MMVVVAVCLHGLLIMNINFVSVSIVVVGGGGEVGASQLARQLQSYADEWQSAILRL